MTEHFRGQVGTLKSTFCLNTMMFRSPCAHVCIVHKEVEGIHRRVTSALVIPQRSIRCKRPVTYYWGGREGKKKTDI